MTRAQRTALASVAALALLGLLAAGRLAFLAPRQKQAVADALGRKRSCLGQAAASRPISAALDGASPVGSAEPSSIQPVTPPIISFTQRPTRASRTAALFAPLRCSPAQWTANRCPRAIRPCAGRSSFRAAGRAHKAGALRRSGPARVAASSPRTVACRFSEEAGSTPLAWLTGERVARAAELLERGEVPHADILSACGSGSAETFRERVPPQDGRSAHAVERTVRCDGSRPAERGRTIRRDGAPKASC